jgi:hypothetical protein
MKKMTKETTIPMTGARFAVLLETYGAGLSRWPEAERLAAHEYATAHLEAVGLLAEARALDTLLAASSAPVPAGLSARVLAQAETRQHAAWALGARQLGAPVRAGFNILWPDMALWKPATVFASAMILGAVLGLQISAPLAANQTVASNDDVLALAAPVLVQDMN